MPQISVIVPVYKVEPYLHRCVDSILAQTYSDFELILVDDGSPDRCGVICDEYAEKDERVHVIHQANGGLSAARNAGIDWAFAHSDSQWLSFIDSDDWVHPQYLELLYKAAQNGNVRICQCLTLETGETIQTYNTYDAEECISVIPVEEQYTNYYSAFAWGKLYRRECFLEIRYPVGQLYEDVAIWYKLLFAEKVIALVKAQLYYYFQRSDSIIHREWTPAKLAQVRAWDEQMAFFSRLKNRKLLETAAIHYFQVTFGQLQLVDKTESLPEKDKKEYRNLLRKKLKKIILRYHYLSFFKEQDLWVYELIYPSASWIYWTAKGILKKLLTKNQGK